MKRNTLRLVFACESLYPGNGGISRVDRLITRVLTEQVQLGELQAVMVVFVDDKAPTDAPLNLTIICCNGSRIKFAATILRLYLNSDIIFYDAAYLARVHPRFPWRKIDSIVFMHGIEVWERAKHSWILACRRADLLICNSEFTRSRADALHGGFGTAKICWLATEPGVEELSRYSEQKLVQILVVGRMSQENAYKGHRELIECWPTVMERIPEARLVFIGRGSLVPELQALTRSLSLDARVEFRGFVSETELNVAYSQSTAFALPSRGEGFGLVYVEAMRHGLPVIASIHDAGAEVIVDGVTGLLVNLDKIGDLAEKICSILSNPILAQEMGRAGRLRWQAYFTYNAFRSRFLSIFDRYCEREARH
jgi:phosphatidylinositol alpha-1,6-mannosyltransferase